MSFARALSKSFVSPYDEMVAYEYLYSLDNSTLKGITEKTVLANKLPSQVVREQLFEPELSEIEDYLDSKLGKLSIAVNTTTTWPDKLKDSERPTPLFYYYGDIGLTELPSISIVGSRDASKNGIKRAKKLARELVKKDFVIVSGLAKGVDTAAMCSAIDNDGKVIGVIGTPIDEYYPRENKELQDIVARDHLLISQVPFYKYRTQPYKTRRWYFPERNELMAAISDATVIVEASDTSGTLSQARACVHQKRPLFLLKSCFERPDITWPRKWAERDNVYVIDQTDQIEAVLKGDHRG